MIKIWLRMKKQEILIKSMLYSTIINIVNDNEDILGFIMKLYTAMKDVSNENFNTELVKNFANIIHEENKDKENV